MPSYETRERARVLEEEEVKKKAASLNNQPVDCTRYDGGRLLRHLLVRAARKSRRKHDFPTNFPASQKPGASRKDFLVGPSRNVQKNPECSCHQSLQLDAALTGTDLEFSAKS